MIPSKFTLKKVPNLYCSFFGILLYSTIALLLSPIQKKVFIENHWQLESIHLKNKEMKGVDLELTGSEKSQWDFRQDGTYRSGTPQRLKPTGTWEIHGRVLDLKTKEIVYPFKITHLSKEEMILKTRTDEGCLRLIFKPIR